MKKPDFNKVDGVWRLSGETPFAKEFNKACSEHWTVTGETLEPFEVVIDILVQWYNKEHKTIQDFSDEVTQDLVSLLADESKRKQ